MPINTFFNSAKEECKNISINISVFLIKKSLLKKILNFVFNHHVYGIGIYLGYLFIYSAAYWNYPPTPYI